MSSSSGEEEGIVLNAFNWNARPSVRALHKDYKLLDTVVVHPLADEYAQEVNLHTSARDLRTPNGKSLKRPRVAQQELVSNFKIINTGNLLAKRELNLGVRPGLSPAQKCHLCCYRNLPKYPEQVVDRMDSRAYIGQYTASGALFVAAFQGQRIRIYDVDCQWQLRKDIHAPLARWTITDTSLSPDQRFLIYSSMTPVVHLVDLGGRQRDEVTSISNITDIHETLQFGSNHDYHSGVSNIWSVAWSGDGRQVVAGSSPAVLLYDVEAARVVARVSAHNDDVNAVTYADDSPNLIISGSDDTMIKVWDRRTLGGSAEEASAAGVLVGHTEGITHLHARGDGRYLLSNSKDQTAKLWDLRRMVSEATAGAHQAQGKFADWDYRRGSYPGVKYDIRHPDDQSLMTFRGHGVLRTLIRAYFSPAHTTGQRFIYTGSFDGSVYIYDSVTGRCVEQLQYHRVLVRDVSWHPYLPQLATVSWDGSVVLWGTQQREGRAAQLPRPGGDVLSYY